MTFFCANRTLILLSLIIICNDTSAQDFLVTSRGDTLLGKIKPLLYGTEKKVQVETADKKRDIYSILNIRTYRYKNENYYPVKGSTGYSFMKLVKRGYLSLYSFQLPGQLSYDGLMLVKLDASSLEVPNLGFKRHMSKFLEDCGKISGQIERGELERKDLFRIIDDYNICVENQSSETIAVKSEINKWDALEIALRDHSDFEQKNTALDMVAEIKGKLQRSEKIPPFIIDGLKNVLAGQEDLQQKLEEALSELPK